MADSGQIPHIVHSPHDRLSETTQTADPMQRQQSLVDPAQHYDIGRTDIGMIAQIHSMRRRRHFEQILTRESVGHRYPETLHHERIAAAKTRLRHGLDAGIIADLVEHDQTGIHPLGIQGLHKTARDNRRSAEIIAVTDKRHFQRPAVQSDIFLFLIHCSRFIAGTATISISATFRRVSRYSLSF